MCTGKQILTALRLLFFAAMEFRFGLSKSRHHGKISGAQRITEGSSVVADAGVRSEAMFTSKARNSFGIRASGD